MDKKFNHALLLAEDVQANLVLDFLYADYHRRPVKKEVKPYVNKRQRIANEVWERFQTKQTSNMQSSQN